MKARLQTKKHFIFGAIALSFSYLLMSALGSLAQASDCESLFLRQVPTGKSDSETLQYLKSRYQVDPSEIHFTKKDHYPVIVRGVGEDALLPSTVNLETVTDPKIHEVIVVGGGPAGLTSALYLTDQGKEVMVIDPNEKLGGLAQGSTLNDVRVGTGAAYSAGADNLEEYKIFQHIGVGDYKSQLTIHEPIDSLFWNGKVYSGIWEPETLKELPASFSVFKQVLQTLAKDNSIYDLNGAVGKSLDNEYATDWIRKMPQALSQMTDRKSKTIYARFLSDATLDSKDPMKDVVTLMNRYSRSALGATADKVSAYALIDFYAKEMGPRYTGTYGTGEIVGKILDKLKDPTRPIKMETSAAVSKIINTAEGAEVHYVKGGKEIVTHAKTVVFSSSLKLAPKIIENFGSQAPEAQSAIDSLQMSNYAVHVVRTKGHPLRQTYDLWFAGSHDGLLEPTDVISSRWQDPAINGYEGMRDFKKNPGDDLGAMTIYQPLGAENVGSGFTGDQSMNEAEKSLDFVRGQLDPYLKEKFGANIDPELIETNRWPLSIHIAHPGWMQQARVFTQPVGNIFFANNNMGLPEFERAMLLGKQAADKILSRLGAAAQ